MPRIVFDIDDTICKDGKKLGYENAIPIQETIDKINDIHENLGAEIILYTARGMGSCKGNTQKAREKNEAILIKWLKDHEVKYDELIFGKPLADLYVDDKAMSLPDFIKKDFCRLQGGSGAKIYRLGDIVVKEMASIEEAEAVKEWAESTILNHPRILGNVYESLYMEYIDGELACDGLNGLVFDRIIKDISAQQLIKKDHFKTENLFTILDANKGINKRVDSLIEACKSEIKTVEGTLAKSATACHGDMTLCNTIIGRDEVYYIDPRPDEEASSYLLDYAKLRMSVDGYERIFGIGSGKDLKWWKRRLDWKLCEKDILRPVQALEFMYILRLTRYGKDPDKIIKFAEGVLEELD